jgi:hypothetical protein
MMVPASQKVDSFDGESKVWSFGDEKLVWHGNRKFALMTPIQSASSTSSDLLRSITVEDIEGNHVFFEEFSGATINRNGLLMLHGGNQGNNQVSFSGLRLYGSVESEPITYFKGGRDSTDHSVPLYFGGGFSGVVLDVNDGSQNDYSSFYTHPYSTGPTGTAGIQNANEISTAYALVDCNALLAFFPGTPLLNQHRGSINPPAFNQDNVLSPDLDAGTLLNLSANLCVNDLYRWSCVCHIKQHATLTTKQVRLISPLTSSTAPAKHSHSMRQPSVRLATANPTPAMS